MNRTKRFVARALLALGPLVSLAACVQGSECRGGRGPVAGAPEDFVPPPASDVTGAQVAAPVICAEDDGQLIAVHGEGERRFGFAGEGCTSPAEADAGELCAEMNIDAFFAQLGEALQRAGIRDLGRGIGACGAELPAGAHVHIDDWSLAGDAVRVVAEELGRWGLGETVGVLVAGIVIACPH